MTTSPLVIASCGAKKAPAACAAAVLYAGSYAQMCLRAAWQLAADAADIRILSARHGLLRLTTVIEPYDTRLSDYDAITTEQLHAQATATGLLHRPVTVLAGAEYTRLVREVWPHAEAPLLGSRGIGEHRQRLARIIYAQAGGHR
ncbi:DUF6884 domain-containing protein [Nocardia brasiliensis]|uniref:DUF6884 domain-containing protein n=1 Tax=Nocardia brasiliensis TaxID=37326 RepID=UPI00245531C1|nr:DUF6884 domain-containing protein [Nocardia brasiliensis]